MEIGHNGWRAVDARRRGGAWSKHTTCRVEATDAGVDAWWDASQEIRRASDDLVVPKQASELVLAERKNVEFLLERCALHQCQAWHDLGIVNVLLQKPRVAVVVAAAKKNVAAVVVVKVELESFYAKLEPEYLFLNGYPYQQSFHLPCPSRGQHQ